MEPLILNGIELGSNENTIIEWNLNPKYYVLWIGILNGFYYQDNMEHLYFMGNGWQSKGHWYRLEFYLEPIETLLIIRIWIPCIIQINTIKVEKKRTIDIDLA